MRSLALVVVVACVPPPLPRIVDVPVAHPPHWPIRQPPPGPTVLPLEPFATATLATSREPAFAPGTITLGRRLSTLGTIDDGVFDAHRRVVIGTANRWFLVDPYEDRVIAEVGKPYDRLSEHELVVRHGHRDAVVDLLDGKTLVPAPKLPIAAPIETTYIVHANEQDGSHWYVVERAEAGADVFLIAIAGGRRFVGLWNDRSPTPELVHEIEETESGWRALRRADGLELRYGIPKACMALRLYRARAPECITVLTDTVNVGSWEVTLDDRRLVAHDLASGRDETVELPCKRPRIDGRSLDVPRVVVDCDDSFVAWTPGHARTLPRQGESMPGYALFGRLPALISDDLRSDQIGHRWLDLDAGRVLDGPVLADLHTESGARIVSLAGTGMATRAMMVDADNHTVREIGPVPCRGRILLDDVKAHYTAFSCGIPDRSGRFDFARVWSKIVDTRSGKLYELPGYPAALFADGTVILSNRTRLTAETRGPTARLTLARLE